MVIFKCLIVLLGASLASFFVVVGERIASHQSIVFPNSHCSICKHELSWYELVPICSYILLKGKCLVCSNKISITSLISEVLSGVLLLTVYSIMGVSIESMIICMTWFSYIVYLNR